MENDKNRSNLAQEFCADVSDLSKKYNLPFFFMTEGAACGIHNNESAILAVEQALFDYEKQSNNSELAEFNEFVDNMTVDDFINGHNAKALVVNEGTMEDSYIFQLFNENKELTSKMLAYIKSASNIDEDMLEEQLIQLKRSNISPLAPAVLAAYARGEIEILYNKSVKVPVSCPFIVRRDPSFTGNTQGIKATIFIANYGTVSKKTGSFVIPMKNLYILLESAYIAMWIHMHPTQLQRNYGLMKILCSIYTSMFTRILSKEYALSLDESLNNSVEFVISKFFLENVWELKNKDVVFNTAQINIQNPNVYELKQVSDAYDAANIKDVSDMLIFVKSLSPRLATLSVQMMIQRFMMMYNGGAVIAIDYLPYLFFTVINTVLGGFLLTQTTLADIVRNNKMIKHFYPELAKMIL